MLVDALSRTLKMLAIRFIRSLKANSIKLIIYSKVKRSIKLAISFTLIVMQIAFPTRNNITNIILNRIVENPIYQLKPFIKRRT
jgi:hypothetical protein